LVAIFWVGGILGLTASDVQLGAALPDKNSALFFCGAPPMLIPKTGTNERSNFVPRGTFLAGEKVLLTGVTFHGPPRIMRQGMERDCIVDIAAAPAS